MLKAYMQTIYISVYYKHDIIHFTKDNQGGHMLTKDKTREQEENVKALSTKLNLSQECLLDILAELEMIKAQQ